MICSPTGPGGGISHHIPSPAGMGYDGWGMAWHVCGFSLCGCRISVLRPFLDSSRRVDDGNEQKNNLQSLALPTELSRGDGSLHLSNANRTRDLGIPSVENGNGHVQVTGLVSSVSLCQRERERERENGRCSLLALGLALVFRARPRGPVTE